MLVPLAPANLFLCGSAVFLHLPVSAPFTTPRSSFPFQIREMRELRRSLFMSNGFLRHFQAMPRLSRARYTSTPGLVDGSLRSSSLLQSARCSSCNLIESCLSTFHRIWQIPRTCAPPTSPWVLPIDVLRDSTFRLGCADAPAPVCPTTTNGGEISRRSTVGPLSANGVTLVPHTLIRPFSFQKSSPSPEL